jgi:hypothetical protein
MFQLIRDKIKELTFEDGGLRELNTYVKILFEKISIKSATTIPPLFEYQMTLKAFDNYAQKQPVYNQHYFNESKYYVLDQLEAFITELTFRKEIIPDKEYNPTYRDHLQLMLSMYEREHIGYFEEQPVRHNSFYAHGRLQDHYIIIGNEFKFIRDSGLLPSMREDIIGRVNYLTESCLAQGIR